MATIEEIRALIAERNRLLGLARIFEVLSGIPSGGTEPDVPPPPGGGLPGIPGPSQPPGVPGPGGEEPSAAGFGSLAMIGVVLLAMKSLGKPNENETEGVEGRVQPLGVLI